VTVSDRSISLANSFWTEAFYLNDLTS